MTRPSSEPTRLAAVVFLLLIVATVAAFFAAQWLKHEPPLLRQKGGDRAFSPNGDGVKDTARITFKLPKPDDVTVTILDEDGGTVARIADNKHLAGKTVHTLRWDGRTSEGSIAPEATYSVRVSLRHGGRTDTLERKIELELNPPKVKLAAVRGPSRGPFVIDGELRRTATVRMTSRGREPSFAVWRTNGGRARLVVPELPLSGDRTASWDGRIGGRRAAPGTYLISGKLQYRAGNVGSAPEQLPPAETGPGPGGIGVLVRPVAITPPLAPVDTGSSTRVTVEAGGRRYRWALRRVGGGVSDRGRSSSRRLRVSIPPGPAGAYILTVQVGRHSARAVIPVEGPKPRRMLVVLPVMTWQGRNDVDDTGDGLPDSLTRGRSARFDRAYARGRLPVGFRENEGALLAFLHRAALDFDIATDIGLARSTSIPFTDHDGVVLAGDTEWFQDSLGKQLRSFVEGGGGVLSMGTESLRRTAVIRGGKLRRPSEPADVDVLGSEIRPLEPDPIELLVQSDETGVFEATAGSLGSFDAFEETASVEGDELLSVAGATGGDPVFVVYRLGKGLVARPGVRGFSTALDNRIGPAAETVRRVWTLLG